MQTVRSRRLLLIVLLGVSLVTGTAFAYTFGSTLAYQQRDGVSVASTDVAVEDGEFAITFTIRNPLDRPVVVRDVELVVYEGSPPYDDAAELSVRREERLASDEVRIGAGETTEVVVRVPARDPDRARSAVDDGTATPSGLFHAKLGELEFTLEVRPDD